jgi:glycosyltransferase involved in cell wall biosynthesis
LRILCCNKYFFVNGGTEKYLSDVMAGLGSRGHEVVPFSVRYANSWPSPYLDQFLPPPGNPEQAHFRNIRLSSGNWLRLLDRGIYSMEARRYLARLIRRIAGADVAYVLNVYNYMSPSILDTLHRFDIPIVMRLGDYNLVCPNYTLLRDGKPCTLCLGGNYAHGLRHRCVKGSLVPSAVRVFSMYLHRWLKLYRQVAAFVVPCNFMKDTLVQAGFPGDRIHLLRTPVPPVRSWPGVRRGDQDYILYFGRISYEKGLDTLLEAYQQLLPPVDLVLIGRSYDGESERLKRMINPAAAKRIRFPGFLQGDELARWIAEALFTVVPSRWYDNAPLSIYESYLHGTPVVASRIGGIPEQVIDGQTGLLFLPDSATALAEALRWMLSDRRRLEEMGGRARAWVVEECSLEHHLQRLLELFRSVGCA